MAQFRNLGIIGIYAIMIVAFIAGNWLAGSQPNLVRWPDTAWLAGTSATHAGLDHEGLGRSVQRLPVIHFMRMLGNNIRILLGQRLEWIIWGEQQNVPVLAAKIDLAIARGLGDPSLKQNLDLLIRRLGQYSRKLGEEGWSLYVVAVPTKLSIYREHFIWPQRDLDPLSLKPVDRDHSDELYDYLGHELARRKVHFVDLQCLFRHDQSAEPSKWLYPPGESHWSEHGIQVASKFTAKMIADELNLRYVDEPPANEIPSIHIGDIVRSMDAFPSFMGQYRTIYQFPETLKQWPVYEPKPVDQDAALIAVLGTSYTGHYSASGAGFAPALGAHLQHAKFYQISQTGIGGFHSFKSFLTKKELLIEEFSKASAQLPDRMKKIVVWEFPIRDFGYLTAESGAAVARISNPNGLEVHRDKQLFWMNDDPTLIEVFATDDGTVVFQSEFYPGPGRRSQNDRTLLIRDETGLERGIPIAYGPQAIRYPVKAGLNRLFWEMKEKSDTLPPPTGDPRTLLLSVFDLQLTYQVETEH